MVSSFKIVDLGSILGKYVSITCNSCLTHGFYAYKPQTFVYTCRACQDKIIDQIAKEYGEPTHNEHGEIAP